MATIVNRNKRYSVVYNYIDEHGERRQKWETYKTLADAKARKKEIEYKQQIGTFVVPMCRTLRDLLSEYVSLYGKAIWSMSTYSGNVSLINNYINPIIGHLKLSEITTRVIETYYQRLLRTQAVDRMRFGVPVKNKELKLVTPSTVREIHKILRNCFAQGVKWELMEKNPCINATLPKKQTKTRDIWDAETLFHAIEVCEDDRLKLALNLSFSCSLRIGEMLGLTWDCVDISQESIENGTAHIYINKELQRVNRDVLKTLANKDVLTVFPSVSSRSKTVMILKTPKTQSSVRKIFLPKTVAEMLVSWKSDQDKTRDYLGDEYQDYNIVLAGPMGMPTDSTHIRTEMNKLIKENDLPPVVFHSLRHSSITYKLKLNGGDIKSVQGDSGHAQAKMVTDQYSHILDNDRKANAQLFEDAFYANKGSTSNERNSNVPNSIDPNLLTKLAESPELLSLLQTLLNK